MAGEGAEVTTPSNVAAMIQRKGEPIVLQRVTTGSPDVNVSATAWVTLGAREPLLGNVAQTQRQVTMADTEIAAAAWPGPPVINDRVQIAGLWFNVEAVETLKIGGVTAMHKLTVRG